MSEANLLQFEPFASAVDPTFWHSLSREKIDVFRLDDQPRDIVGYYQIGKPSDDPPTALSPSRLFINGTAFESHNIPRGALCCPGLLKNTNTIEDYKGLDKVALFRHVAELIWADIESGAAMQDPSLLCRFVLLTYADLKKYKFYYWFGFPALLPPEPITLTSAVSINDVLNETQVECLRSSYNNFRLERAPAGQYAAFFLIRLAKGTVTLGGLDAWEGFTSSADSQVWVGFADPSSLSRNPGWPLRNLLILIKRRWGLSRVQVLCYRESAKGGANNSFVLNLSLPGDLNADCPKFVGWEKNAAGKLAPRMVDLAPLMDPKRLADTAVDLNLKLMRWRVMPSLPLEKIASTKCLLLGSGTLGCYVARSLLGWGVRHITFVDNGRVSFSNPVRQPLFTFDDCLDGGAPKAVAAARNLSKIFPGVTAAGYQLSIPMPGHPVDSDISLRDAGQQLSTLIQEHDAVFLLTDSRESRWLPSVLGASYGKIVINAALGFDTFLVMRHGMRTAPLLESREVDEPLLSKHSLGCYFCNDVVAPTDSMKDRTLDQQCTVTRPGISAMASAMAVELLVSILNHPQGAWAAADTTASPSEPTKEPLGLIPHQIRGFLTHFNNLLVVGQSYDKCTACSAKILKLYEEEGMDFVAKVVASPDYLEEVSGLKELHQETDLLGVDWEADEEDW
ncbi:Autophagy protein 7 [Gaertneriomyces sp. JEL0708]|nr:Autophagy protein 7 [Gaertneriomyces sp. JEL0708]